MHDWNSIRAQLGFFLPPNFTYALAYFNMIVRTFSGRGDGSMSSEA